METKNKITVIVTSMLIVAVSLMSCKTNHSFRAVYQKSDYYDVEVGASYVSFPEEGMRFMTAPGYTFKLPGRMILDMSYTGSFALILLEKHQYIGIEYDSDFDNIGYEHYSDSDYDRLVAKIDNFLYDPEKPFKVKLYRQFEKAMSNKSNDRINHIFRKDGFVIGLINFMPQNKDSITKLIEETFKIKKYEGQSPIISFLKDLH